MIAEAIAVFDCNVHAIEHVAVFIERRVHIQRSAIAIPATGAEIETGKAVQLRPLADDIDGAARITASVKAGRRPLEHFDPLDIGSVRWVNEAAVDAETVLVELSGGQPAHAVFVHGQAAEIVLPSDAAGEIQRLFDAWAVQILQHGCWNDADRLRYFLDGRVGFRRAARAVGTVALHRSIGAFLIGRDDDRIQYRRVLCHSQRRTRQHQCRSATRPFQYRTCVIHALTQTPMLYRNNALCLASGCQ